MKTAIFFIQISVKIILNGLVSNKPALVQIIIWTKPFSESVMA